MSLQSVPAHHTRRGRLSRAVDTRLSGRRLTLIRTGWIVLVACILVYFFASLPETFVTVHQPCVGHWCVNTTGRLTAIQMQSLEKVGISLDTYAWFFLIFTGVTSLFWFGVAGILFWRKSDDWMALLVALMLITVGADSITNTLLYSSSFWRFVEEVLYFGVSQTIFLTLALFPNGRFVPRWSFCFTLLYPAIYVLCYLLFLHTLRVPLYSDPVNAVTWFGSWTVLTLAQIYRYFRVSSLVERQQTKWAALGFSLTLISGLVGLLLGSYLAQNNGLLYALGNISLSPLFLLPLPLSIGFAMQRSHLWDIDIIINKALVYGLLTALLAAVYAGLIIGLQFLLGGIIKQNNDVAIVVSTLAIAALFMPLRRRIQAIIDRRFYRRKYDAARTLQAFTATLRNEVDLAALSEHLVGVVEETMQPAHVSLWLSKSAQRSKSHSNV